MKTKDIFQLPAPLSETAALERTLRTHQMIHLMALYQEHINRARRQIRVRRQWARLLRHPRPPRSDNRPISPVSSAPTVMEDSSVRRHLPARFRSIRSA